MNTIKGSVEKIFYNNASFYILSIKVNNLDGIDNDKLNPQYPFFITVVGKSYSLDNNLVLLYSSAGQIF